MWLIGLLLAIAWVPETLSGFVAPRWCVLAVAGALLVATTRIRPTTGHLLGLLFLMSATLSLLWVPDLPAACGQLAKWVILAWLFCAASSIEDLRPFYRGLTLGIAISGVIAVLQWYLWFNPIPQATMETGPSGLFFNKNTLAEIAVLALIGAVYSRCWLLLPFVATAAFLPGSRGALIALVIAGFAWLLTTRWREWSVPLVILCLAPIVGHLEAQNFYSAIDRIDLWKQVLPHLTAFGAGVGQFQFIYPGASYAHNDLLQAVYEHGVFALPLVLLFTTALRGVGPERFILIAFLVEGCFAFPLELPATAGVAAIVAGTLCGHGNYLRRARHERRMVLSNCDLR